MCINGTAGDTSKRIFPNPSLYYVPLKGERSLYQLNGFANSCTAGTGQFIYLCKSLVKEFTLAGALLVICLDNSISLTISGEDFSS